MIVDHQIMSIFIAKNETMIQSDFNKTKTAMMFLLIPLFSFSQKAADHWLTPIANIEFNDARIIYSYSKDKCVNFTNIHPVYFNPHILKLKGVYDAGCTRDYLEMIKQMHDYLNDWNYDKANNRDKELFLRTASLMIIWNGNNESVLPENTLEILGCLNDDKSTEIGRKSRLVISLYEDYYKKEILK